MKKFFTLYTSMTNCCFIFSLQAGVVLIGVLGIVWTATSMIINLFLPYESTATSNTTLQHLVAYLVLILICGGHVWILLAGGTANTNLMFLGFLYNTIITMFWLVLTALSFFDSPNLRAVICIEGRCPDVLWLFDAYWRDTGIKCKAGTGVLATREIFSTAPDYIEQPRVCAPCYENIPDTADYVAYDVAANVSCVGGDCMSWDSDIVQFRKKIDDGGKRRKKKAEENEQKAIVKNTTGKPSARRLRFNCPNGYSNCLPDDFYCIIRNKLNCTIQYDDFKGKNQNGTAEFNQLLQQGCELNQPRFIVVSLALALFFSCFFLFGRAIEFNYYHELIMPFTLERSKFRPPESIIMV